ncbi:MAG: hypothetical protein HY554_08865 [Elusimicrobia bacterium]|nr:hypothetical protein [Elusimicrobiota bacterium]
MGVLLTRRLAAALSAAALAACASAPPRPASPSAAVPAPPSAAVPTSASVPELLGGIEAAYREGRFDDGLALVRRTLELGYKDLSVVDRVGSIYHLLGRYGEAIAVWEQGLRLEKDAARRAELERSIALARRSIGLPDEDRAAPLPPARPAPARPASPSLRKRVERLYEDGVAYYARGEYLQATSLFVRVLELDPDHALARSALARLRLKPGARQKNGDPG